jgi:UDP-N-acetylmuramoyl-L-alanyl-D-glutamate--2,6-diaminopimelate ligase
MILENFVSTTPPQPRRSASPMRPEAVEPVTLRTLREALADAGFPPLSGAEGVDWGTEVTGISMDSRGVEPGDLYVALRGANRHGAEFGPQVAAAGAAAILTDDDGVRLLEGQSLGGVPVLTAGGLRDLVGPLSARIFNSQPAAGPRPLLFGVTGTNGKTTTTYFVNSLLKSLGRTTGLIGTIEIVAGDEPIPSALTTPESPQVHGILALMRERGLDAAAMEVSSHAISYRRVDGVRYDVAGFTNLTQDHLDLHGSMEDYFRTKAKLFTPERAQRAVVCVDDEWGRRLAGESGIGTVTLATQGGLEADWSVRAVERVGLGHSFELHGPGEQMLTARTGLPGSFNVSNAALALVMLLASGVGVPQLQHALDTADPLTVEVPGRMQLIGAEPAAIVDFAHNPDALERTLASVRRPEDGSKVIIVFGATGERDQSKRPLMGAIAARLADVVIVTDDDPHGEDEQTIRTEVLGGAQEAVRSGALQTEVLEVFPRGAAIDRAVAMASPADTVLVAGRGHEVFQEVKGVNVELDDRVELRAALRRYGFSALGAEAVES